MATIRQIQRGRPATKTIAAENQNAHSDSHLAVPTTRDARVRRPVGGNRPAQRRLKPRRPVGG
jgi:hypothetical protein